jgi:hypothetical protein
VLDAELRVQLLFWVWTAKRQEKIKNFSTNKRMKQFILLFCCSLVLTAKPSTGGREQEVTNFNSSCLSSYLNCFTTSQKTLTVACSAV